MSDMRNRLDGVCQSPADPDEQCSETQVWREATEKNRRVSYILRLWCWRLMD